MVNISLWWWYSRQQILFFSWLLLLTVAPDFVLEFFFKAPVTFVILSGMLFLITHTSGSIWYVLFSVSWSTDFPNSFFTTFRSTASSFIKNRLQHKYFFKFWEISQNSLFWNPFEWLLLLNHSFCLLFSFSKQCHTYLPAEYFLGLIYRTGTRVSSIFQPLIPYRRSKIGNELMQKL